MGACKWTYGKNGRVPRVGGGGTTADGGYYKAAEKYTVDYEPYARGLITRTEAGQLYKAVKNGNVEAKPELSRELYSAADAGVAKYASRNYTQDPRYYDAVYNMTHALLNNDYKTAQNIINNIQADNIKRATRKSPWFKYKGE